jgi:outer membrane protein assembly factor BamB
VNSTVPVTVFATPTVVDDKVIIAFAVEGGPVGPPLVALDRYVGSIVWRGADPDQPSEFANLRNSPARYGDELVVASSLSLGVQGVDAASGEARWETAAGIWCEKQRPSAIVVGDLVVLPRPDGSVHGFDAASGEVRWRITPAATTEDPLSSDCAYGGEQVHDGFEFHASAAVAPDGTLIVASTSNAIYAIGERN